MSASDGYTHGRLDEVLRTVKAYKEQAKLLRDDGDVEGAVEVLQEAAELLRPAAPEPDASGELTESRKQVAWNLADTLGMLGGNYRRMGRLDDALTCFEEGKRYEENAAFGIESTYNLINAITVPIEMARRTATEQKAALSSALAALERGTNGPRRLDRWAWADLGQTALLAGERERATVAYSRFRELGDQASIASHVTVLRRLRDALADRDVNATDALEEGIQFLEQKASVS